jgi:hypothetical protein
MLGFRDASLQPLLICVVFLLWCENYVGMRPMALGNDMRTIWALGNDDNLHNEVAALHYHLSVVFPWHSSIVLPSSTGCNNWGLHKVPSWWQSVDGLGHCMGVMYLVLIWRLFEFKGSHQWHLFMDPNKPWSIDLRPIHVCHSSMFEACHMWGMEDHRFGLIWGQLTSEIFNSTHMICFCLCQWWKNCHWRERIV